MDQAPGPIVNPNEQAEAIRDTIAAVFKQREYDRSLRQTLWERFLFWFGDLIDRASDALGSSPVLYWTTVAIVGLCIVALAARVAYLHYVRGELIAEGRLG